MPVDTDNEAATLLPINATESERAAEAVIAARLDAVEVPIADLWNPWTCPVSLLPALAWSLSVDTWSDSWSELQKRTMIDAAYTIHSTKGTIGAMRTALAALDYNLKVIEWFEESAQAGTFRIEVDTTGLSITEGLYTSVETMANSAKRESQHLSSIQVISSLNAAQKAAAVMTGGQIVTIYPFTLELLTTNNTSAILSGIYKQDIITITEKI